MNLPNKLTVARLVMVPIFVLLMSFEYAATYICAYIVFIVASYTDYLDGKIARELGQETNFGRLMDPLADKVLLTAAFVMLMQVSALWIPAWTIVAILGREFLVTGGRALAASEGAVIAASMWGKVKTVIHMIYIYTFLFFAIVLWAIQRWAPDHAELYATVLGWSSFIAILFVALFTLYTGLEFARANWQTLNLGSQK